MTSLGKKKKNSRSNATGIEAKTKPFGKASQSSAPPPSFTSSAQALSDNNSSKEAYSYVIGAGGQRAWAKQSWQGKA